MRRVSEVRCGTAVASVRLSASCLSLFTWGIKYNVFSVRAEAGLDQPMVELQQSSIVVCQPSLVPGDHNTTLIVPTI